MAMKNSDTIKLKGSVIITIQDAKTGRIKSVDKLDNMVVTLGKIGIASGLMGDTTKGYITYCAVGTSTTAPALTDTALIAELARKLISTREVNSNSAVFTTYFGTSEANGTLREAGLFGDSTASLTANSGRLYCRLAISRTKSSADTLTISWTLTVG
jgi:hypothetical protein